MEWDFVKIALLSFVLLGIFFVWDKLDDIDTTLSIINGKITGRFMAVGPPD